MSATDRYRTRWFVPLAFVAACVGHVTLAAPAVPEPTPLELRVLQSRKFLKPIVHVTRAIKTYGEDAGAQCVAGLRKDAPPTQPIGQVACSFPFEIKRGVFTVKIKEKILRFTGELVGDEASTETTVRLRIYKQMKDGSTVQVTEPEIYSEVFARIGEALLIAAIPIDAATQE